MTALVVKSFRKLQNFEPSTFVYRIRREYEVNQLTPAEFFRRLGGLW